MNYLFVGAPQFGPRSTKAEGAAIRTAAESTRGFSSSLMAGLIVSRIVFDHFGQVKTQEISVLKRFLTFSFRDEN